MSQRVLPSPTSIDKVTVLLSTRFQTPYEATELGRKKVINDDPVADDYDKTALPQGIAERRQRAMDEYMEKEQGIRKIPDSLRLTMGDMPKILKRDDGEEN